jgi:hypothetical protein
MSTPATFARPMSANWRSLPTLTATVGFIAGAVVCPMAHLPRRFLRVRKRSLFPS